MDSGDGPRRRVGLTAAERLRRAEAVTFEPADPRDQDAQWAMEQYFCELDDRFPNGFDAGDATTEGVAALLPPTGIFLLAMSEGRTAGCGGVQRIDGHTGEIKRMWIHPGWRGLGVGGRLLDRLEAEARRLGYVKVQLDTNSVLTVARAMYEGAGYEAIERYNDNPYARHWFAKEL